VQSLSEAKPLRWSFLLTFSIVLVAIWVVVSVFAHSQRSRLVDELVVVVARGTEKEAKAALRQMVHMPDPPVESFAIAATSPSRPVARQAQDSICELLRKWQGQAKSPRGAARVAIRLERLASALDAERDALTALDYPWLAKTTEKILRLANTAPPENALDLALHCESLLETASAPRADLQNIVPVASADIDEAPAAIFSPPSRLALESIVSEAEPSEIQNVDVPSPQENITPNRLPRPFDRDGGTARKVASPIPVDQSDSPVPNVLDPWATIDSRALLERWLAAKGATKTQVERELQRRGFGHLRSDVVRLALSDDGAARSRLVQDLLAMPGVGAKAWLMLLADDRDAEVRFAALTVMATSKDRQLLEKAWQVALHDRDPRIAGLAERLKERR
jgi:hypothetical protein